MQFELHELIKLLLRFNKCTFKLYLFKQFVIFGAKQIYFDLLKFNLNLF